MHFVYFFIFFIF